MKLAISINIMFLNANLHVSRQIAIKKHKDRLYVGEHMVCAMVLMICMNAMPACIVLCAV